MPTPGWPARTPASAASQIESGARWARDAFPERSSLGRVYVRLPTVVIAGRLLGVRIPLLATFAVALDVSLLGPSHPGRPRQGPRRHVLADHRAGRRVRIVTHADRRHEGRVHAGFDPRADGRAVLALAVVVGGDRRRAEVRVLAHVGVTDVGEVGHLGAAADLGVLDLDERADLRSLAQDRARPQI